MDNDTTAPSDTALDVPDVEELSSFCKKENLLGSGGYGEVYRGLFEVDGIRKAVAIKRIPRDKKLH